jgi:hypothetical protein
MFTYIISYHILYLLYYIGYVYTRARARARAAHTHTHTHDRVYLRNVVLMLLLVYPLSFVCVCPFVALPDAACNQYIYLSIYLYIIHIYMPLCVCVCVCVCVYSCVPLPDEVCNLYI